MAGQKRETTDISLAIRIDDLTLLECAFRTKGPLGENKLQSRLSINDFDASYSVDATARRKICKATVSVQFCLVDPDNPKPSNEGGFELVHFDLLAGVVATVPLMVGLGPDADAARDRKMEHMLRLESIKAVYAFAQAKLAETSALSPARTILLPLIDADTLLNDIEKRENLK